MKSPNRRLLTILITVIMLSFLTGNAQATTYGDNSTSMSVSIQSASYLDHDADMVEDDILTLFTISIPSGTWKSGYTVIYMVLELPSGSAFGCNLLVIGFFSHLSLTLAWYNTATEAGIYRFSVSAYMLGNSALKPGHDSLSFDPPTEGEPGSPIIEIVGVTAT
jgi:hypothetical protein